MSGAPREEVPVGLPRNYLRPCLLLLLAEGTSHGYELLEQVSALGLDRVDPGGLYRSLRAMDEEGLVRSSWQPSASGPARRTYQLTDEGREWLHAVAGSLAEISRSLEAYRARYQAVLEQSRPAR
ncbi:PadR family transcriptional regulator [Geodermatophilus chilensis]|jgi:PadR family transcriptional regulator PadR|uniref:PadR family transcriptional regulator n=1 Tax=Geodermatophilus chilensis TaxID=2035835 RepID=UPI000C257096|nr:PadR family transcriptional regulator [Geodermatophilus chilensis]